ncbi:MAG: hypothetical protein AAF518_28530 [Spirochaetota bacterium]
MIRNIFKYDMFGDAKKVNKDWGNILRYKQVNVTIKPFNENPKKWVIQHFPFLKPGGVRVCYEHWSV